MSQSSSATSITAGSQQQSMMSVEEELKTLDTENIIAWIESQGVELDESDKAIFKKEKIKGRHLVGATGEKLVNFYKLPAGTAEDLLKILPSNTDPINLSVDELFQEVNNHIVLIDKASESTRFNPFFVGRQKSIESAISCIKSNRDRLGTNPEKAKFQVPVCSGQVGVGKTSLALEIAKRYPQSPNEEVKIAIMDLKNGGGYLRGLPSSQEDWNSSVLLRILYYFFSSKGKDFQSFYATFSRYKQLHDPIVVSRLMNMKASLAKEQTLSFFFIVDEYQTLADESKPFKDEPLYSFIKGFSRFFFQRCNGIWVQPILAGVKHPEYLRDRDPTEASYYQVPISLLTFPEILEVVDRIGESLFPNGQYAAKGYPDHWRKNLPFLIRVKDSGPLPRVLTDFLEILFGVRYTDASFFLNGEHYQVSVAFETAIKLSLSRYPAIRALIRLAESVKEDPKEGPKETPIPQEDIKKGLLYATTGLPCSKHINIMLDLERRGVLFLNITDGNRVQIPLYFIRELSENRFLGWPNIWGYLYSEIPFQPSNWENFNAEYLAFRIMALNYLEYKEVSLGFLFEGAWGTTSLKELKVSTRELVTVVKSQDWRLLGNLFLQLKSNEGQIINPNSGAFVILNADHAPGLDLYTVPTENLAVGKQLKLSKVSAEFSETDMREELDKNLCKSEKEGKKKIQNPLEANQRIVTIFVMNRPAKFSEAIFHKAEEDPPLSDAMIIAQGNMTRYFGCCLQANIFFSFARRLLNFCLPKDLVNILPGVGETLAPFLLKNRPFKTYQQLYDNLSASSHKVITVDNLRELFSLFPYDDPPKKDDMDTS